MGVSSEADLEALRRGVELGGGVGVSKTAQVEMDVASGGGVTTSSTSGNNWSARVTITIRKGKNGQVRRKLHAVGHGCIQLEMVKVEKVTLAGLMVGEWRELTAEEIEGLGYERRLLNVNR